MNFETHTTSAESELLDTLKMIEDLQKRRIDMSDFLGHEFTDERQLEEDLTIVRRLNEKFEKDPKLMTPEKLREFEMGNAAEYTFVHAMEKAGWLGPNTTSIVASEYDDYVRGIDSIAQIELGEGRFEHFGFAIDFGTSKAEVGKKMLKTIDSIDRGYSPSVRYFDSPKTGKLKEFKLPRVVVGAGAESLERLVNYSKEILNGSGASEKSKKELENDPFKYVVLGEIMAQLDFCINRLRKVVEEGKSKQDVPLQQRAGKSLSLHQNALTTLMAIMDRTGVKMEDVQKNIKGDAYALEIARSLSLLSPLPIGFTTATK